MKNDFLNLSDSISEPIFFYRVYEFVTTFRMDEGKHEGFSTFEDFKGDNLHECRAKAIKHYYQRLEGLERTKYYLPFESPENFEFGKHAAASIILYLVEYYNDQEEIVHALMGEDDDTTAESREIEADILRKNK